MTTTEQALMTLLKEMAGMVKERERVMAHIAVFASKLIKHGDGLKEMAKTIECGTEENIRKQLKNTMISTSLLCENMVLLNIIVLAYVSGTFLTDGLKLCTSAGGNPEIALKWLINQKM